MRPNDRPLGLDERRAVSRAARMSERRPFSRASTHKTGRIEPDSHEFGGHHGARRAPTLEQRLVTLFTD